MIHLVDVAAYEDMWLHCKGLGYSLEPHHRGRKRWKLSLDSSTISVVHYFETLGEVSKWINGRSFMEIFEGED